MRPYRISDSVGCVSHHTIQEADGEIFFLAENGIYSLRGADLRRISADKVQWFLDRIDPARLHKSVAAPLGGSGIYRINISPEATYATTVRSGVNSWYLDYHYTRSRNHVPFFEPIWSHGEREVSCYGRYVSEDNVRYTAFGNYRGAVALDNIPETWTEELGWSRGSSVLGTFTTASDATVAGTYTITVNANLPTDGDGLKGLQVHLRSATDTESATVLENTTNTIVLRTAASTAYSAGDWVFVSPILTEYKSGWQDLGSTLRDKKTSFMKLDHRLENAESTLTVSINFGRDSTAREYGLKTHTVHLNDVTEKLDLRGRGKHFQVVFQHDWPGERFEIFNWEILASPGRSR